MIAPEQEEFEVGNQSNYDEDQHIDVPLKPEIQQDLSVGQGKDAYIQLVTKIGMALSIQAELHFACDHSSLIIRNLIIPETDPHL